MPASEASAKNANERVKLAKMISPSWDGFLRTTGSLFSARDECDSGASAVMVAPGSGVVMVVA